MGSMMPIALWCRWPTDDNRTSTIDQFEIRHWPCSKFEILGWPLCQSEIPVQVRSQYLSSYIYCLSWLWYWCCCRCCHRCIVAIGNNKFITRRPTNDSQLHHCANRYLADWHRSTLPSYACAGGACLPTSNNDGHASVRANTILIEPNQTEPNWRSQWLPAILRANAYYGNRRQSYPLYRIGMHLIYLSKAAMLFTNRPVLIASLPTSH